MARETQFGVTRDVHRDSSGNVISSRVISKSQLETEQASIEIGIKLLTILASIAGVLYGLYLIVSKYDAIEFLAIGLYWLSFFFIVIPRASALFFLNSVRLISKLSACLFILIILINFANALYGETVVVMGEHIIWGPETTVFEGYYMPSFIGLIVAGLGYMVSAYFLED